jgi:WD40-like Beta Propeller Repeat
MRPARIVSVVLAAAAVSVPAVARADIIAATEVPGAGGSFATDIALIDLATGTHLGLPAGVNTAQAELHPSLSADGRRMVFERFDTDANTTRIIAVDLATGQQADLFDAFESAQLQPTTPTISPDGQTVFTGMPSQQSGNGLAPAWTETSLAAFPNGPFPHTVQVESNLVFNDNGLTRNPAVTPSGVVAMEFTRDTGSSSVLVDFQHKNALISDSTGGLTHPALSDQDAVVVFEKGAGGGAPSDIDFRTLDAQHLPGASTFEVSGAIDSADLQFKPAFTPDGRYIAFVRFVGSDAHLLVFDTETQQLLDPNGVVLGRLFSGRWLRNGNVSLRVAFVLRSSAISFSGPTAVVRFVLAQQSGVGILVQRVVGHHRLLGRRVPKLRTVGRVPFGNFRHGGHRVRWHLRVGGKRLRRGTYLVTPRALTGRGAVRELGKPRVVKIR